MKFEKKNILAHRGCWKRYSEEDKNSRKALFKALEIGFGIETDIRFYKNDERDVYRYDLCVSFYKRIFRSHQIVHQ